MISVVVPVLNEEESLSAFYEELIKQLKLIQKPYEIVFIDDGSTDNSLSLLKSYAKENNHVRVFSFRRNLGKSEALSCGFAHTKGEYIVTLDADLQDKPSEIQKLLTKAESGVDVVCGWRKDRKDKSQMLVISKLFNKIFQSIFGVDIHDYNCGLKVYSKDAAKSLQLYGGLYRFIPLIAAQQGFVVDEVVVEHERRRFGKSKYGFSKIFTNLPDAFTILFLAKFAQRPLHFFGSFGSLFVFIGVAIIAYLTIIHTFMDAPVAQRPILFIGMVFVLAGLQTFFTGFLADLIINISHKARSDAGNRSFPLKYSSDNK